MRQSPVKFPTITISRNTWALLEIQIFGMKCKAPGAQQPEGLLGSDANFIAVRCTAPEGRAGGTMNLDSDPKNPRAPRNAAIRPKNEFIEVPI